MDYLSPVFDNQGYRVIATRTRRDALVKAQKENPAVIVLDCPSLRFSSHRFCRALQDGNLEIPVLLLLSEEEKIDRSVGARGHLRYPFSPKKLINRIVRLLPAPDDEVLQVGDVILNVKQRHVIRDKQENHLTPKQAQLLEILMRHPGEVLTRAFLMKRVWETDYLDDTRTLDVHIHCVRKAIEDNPRSPVYIRTVRQVGYRFETSKKKK